MIYVDTPTCALPRQAEPGRLPEAGQAWTCPQCGRVWYATVRGSYGGMPVGDWVSSAPPGSPPVQAQVTDALARTVQPRQAQVAVVGIAVNGKLDVTATWDTAYPDVNYRYDVLVPAALLGKVTVAEKAKAAAAVTLTLTASQVVVTGSVLNLIGARWA